MKKLKVLFVFAMLISLSACGSSKNETSSDKDVLTKALQQFEKLESVEMSSKSEGTMVGSDQGSLVSFPFDNEVPLSVYKKGKDSLLTQIITKDGIYILKKITDKTFSIDFSYEDTNVNNGLIISGIVTRISEINLNKNGFKGTIDNLEYCKKYLDDDFKNCISISSKNDKDNKVISLNIKDVDLFNKKLIETNKETDPNYDPLVWSISKTGTKIKFKKNEQTTLNIDFTIDSNNNILQVKHHDIIDYGDNYITNTTQTSKYKKFNNAKIDSQEIDDLFKKANDGELQEGATVNFKNIPSI